MGRRAFRATALLVCAAACKTYGESDVPEDAGADAGSFSADSSAPSSEDAAQVDGGQPVDAASPCNSTHLFCDDLDERGVGSIPDWGDAPTIDPNASMRVRSFAAAVSAPNVVESKVTNGATARLAKTFSIPVAQGGLTCSFSYQVVTQEQGSFASLAELSLVAGTSQYNVDFRDYAVVTSGGKTPDGGAAPPAVSNFASAGPGVWTKVVISMSLGSDGRIEVHVGDSLVTAVVPAAVAPTTKSARLQLGTDSLTTSGDWQVVYDDVVCDLL